MQKLLAVSLASLFFCSYSNAQVNPTTGTSQSGDILVIGNGWTGTVSTCIHNYNCWAGSSDQGDIHHGYDRSTGMGNTYYWSGTQQTLSNTIAINTALQATGIQVDGFSYEWVYKNGNANWFSGQPGGGQVDPFEIVVNVYKADGSLFQSFKYDYGNQFANWTTKTGTETFGTPFLDPSYFGNVVVDVTGQDIANQAGYWGPEFRADQSHLYVNYSNNPCHNNQLYDPQCPGYANALFQQQCQQSALYDPACPGYATAYLNQQCTINVLYDAACPGYSTAYYNQQCTNDPLSDPGCPDYYVAQCEKDPLYDMGCVGYDAAYYDYQCSLDAQYDQGCTGYVDMTNDQDFVEIFDPVVEEILEDEYTDNIYLSELTVPDFVVEFFEEALDVDIMFVDNEEFEQALEDDIEEEIRQLEQEEEPEVEELFEDTETKQEVVEDTQRDFDDPTNVGGQQDVDDDIEKEIEALEKDAGEGNDKPVENEGVQEPSSDVRSDTVERPKPDSRREKIRLLIAAKAIEATKELENAITLEQQMDIQRRVLALISFVPDFKDEYTNKELTQVNFYPPKPVVDHQYARWFLNDPNFSTMEDLQYPSLRRE